MTGPPNPPPWDRQQRPPVPPTSPQAAGKGPHRPQQGPAQPPGSAPQPSNPFRITGKQVAAIIIGILALIFILENNANTRVRLIIPVVHLPLYIALFLSAVLGAAVTFLLMWRRHRVEERQRKAHPPGQPPGPNLNR